MLGNFFNFTPTVTEEGSFYIINNINVKGFEYDLKRAFGTVVIANRVIKQLGNNKFKIHKFFTLELVWVLDNLLTNQDEIIQRYYVVGLNKYNQLYNELKEKTWIKSIYDPHVKLYSPEKALKDFTFKPTKGQSDFLHQYGNIKIEFQLKGQLLSSEPGTGKTFTSLVWSRMVGKHKKIILAPKHLIVDPWLDHITKNGNRYCFNKESTYWTSLDDTNPLDKDVEFYIFHTETIRKDSYNGISFEKILKTLSKNGKEPLVMVIDECHRYNEITSQQTQGLINFASSKYISDVLFMSGTPIKAQGRETYPLFCVIDPYFDKFVREDFLKLYGRNNYFLNEMLAHRLGNIKFTVSVIDDMDEPPKPEIIKVKFEGIEQFTLENIRIRMNAYIKKRIEMFKEYMPQIREDFNNYLKQYENTILNDKKALVRLNQYRKIIEYFRRHGYNNLTDGDKSKFCKEVEKDIEKGLKGEDLQYFRFITPAIKYLGLKIRGEALGNVLGKARIEAILMALQHANLPKLINGVKKKTVIYTTYLEVINKTSDYLIKEGFNPITFYSETKEPVDNLLDKFREDSNINPLITTYSSLSEGKPLLMANQLILLNTPWRDFILKQTIARIHRKGQDSKCYVWLIDLDTGNEDNIASRSIDIMQYYKDIVDQLLNENNNLIRDVELSVKGKIDNNTLTDLAPITNDILNFRPKFNFDDFISIFRK